jgi:hypothetical protein
VVVVDGQRLGGTCSPLADGTLTTLELIEARVVFAGESVLLLPVASLVGGLDALFFGFLMGPAARLEGLAIGLPGLWWSLRWRKS